MKARSTSCACGCGREIPSTATWDGMHGPGEPLQPRVPRRRWWQRKRYSVWQVQGGERVLQHGQGLPLREARRDAATVNSSLLLFKLVAPSGPQDAHAIVVLDGTDG